MPSPTVSSQRDTIIARNNVQVIGNGSETILFAHGFGCDQNMWRFMTPAFEDKYRLVLFDFVGSGKSDLKAFDHRRYSDLSGYAQDVLDICAALDLKDVIFIGHSVSCMIGVLASIVEPELFSRLILITPSPCYINDPPHYHGGFEKADIEGLLEMMEKNYIGWASFLAPMIMKNANRSELGAELTESFCSTDPEIAKRFAKTTFYSDNRSDLGKVTVPSLIIQCTDDAIAPECVGEFMHQKLNGSTLRLIEASGHCPHMSHPDDTLQAINEYIAG